MQTRVLVRWVAAVLVGLLAWALPAEAEVLKKTDPSDYLGKSVQSDETFYLLAKALTDVPAILNRESMGTRSSERSVSPERDMVVEIAFAYDTSSSRSAERVLTVKRLAAYRTSAQTQVYPGARQATTLKSTVFILNDLQQLSVWVGDSESSDIVATGVHSIRTVTEQDHILIQQWAHLVVVAEHDDGRVTYFLVSEKTGKVFKTAPLAVGYDVSTSMPVPARAVSEAPAKPN